MYYWITLLYTWNQHDIVNQLYFNFKKQKSEKVIYRQTWKKYIYKHLSLDLFSQGSQHLKVCSEKVAWGFELSTMRSSNTSYSAYHSGVLQCIENSMRQRVIFLDRNRQKWGRWKRHLSYDFWKDFQTSLSWTWARFPSCVALEEFSQTIYMKQGSVSWCSQLRSSLFPSFCFQKVDWSIYFLLLRPPNLISILGLK